VERLRAGEPAVPAKPAAPVVVRVRDLENPFLKVRATMGLRPATLKQDASTLRAHIIPRIGSCIASEVNVATLLVFVDKLKAAGLSASTIRNVLSVVRCLFDVSAARQLAPIVVNPTRDPVFVRQGRPKRTRSPKPQIAIEVAEKLLTHDDVPEHWKLRILIGCTGGP
jgi:site-specific recombinase XerC